MPGSVPGAWGRFGLSVERGALVPSRGAHCAGTCHRTAPDHNNNRKRSCVKDKFSLGLNLVTLSCKNVPGVTALHCPHQPPDILPALGLQYQVRLADALGYGQALRLYL